MASIDDRVKTDVRMPQRVMRHLDEQSRRLGIPKNSYFILALCRQVADMARFIKGKKKRQALLKDVEDLFQKTIADARRA